MKIFIIIFLFLYNQFSLAEEKKTLRIGYFNNRPFTYLDVKTGKDSGIIIDIIRKKILKFDQYKLTFQQFPLSRVLKEVSAGNLDIVAMLGRNPEREKQIDFSVNPIYTTENYAMVLKTSKLNEITSVADLKDETIGIVQNSAYCDFINTNKSSLRIDETANENFIPILVNKLIHKRITVAYAFLPEALHYEAKSMGFTPLVKMVKVPSEKVSVHMAFSKNFNKKLKQEIEENLKKYHIDQVDMN